MSQIASQEAARPRKVAVPSPVPGTTWFGAMVAVWSTLITLLIVSPETLEDMWDWIVGLPLVAEIAMWIAVLPWALAYVIADSTWDQWLRVLVVGLVAAAHLIVSAPRQKR